MEQSVKNDDVVKPDYPGFTPYSFRTESTIEAVTFLYHLYGVAFEKKKRICNVTMQMNGQRYTSYCVVEFISEFTLTELLDVMRIPFVGKSTMIETLRPVPLMLNNLERDFSTDP